MGFTGGYYTGGGNSAGTVMAILLLLAVVLTVLAFIFIVPENRREKLNAFGKFLHDTCNFNYLLIEKILQALDVYKRQCHSRKKGRSPGSASHRSEEGRRFSRQSFRYRYRKFPVPRPPHSRNPPARRRENPAFSGNGASESAVPGLR